MAGLNMPQNLFGGNPFGGGGGMASAVSGGGQNPFLKFLSSDGGSSLLSGVLGGLGAMGQGRSQERMNEQQLAGQREGMGMNDAFNRDMALTQAAPTGWGQNYQQQTMMKQLMLQKLMNGSGGPQFSDPRLQEKYAAVRPEPLTIPDEWQQMNPFGVDQTMNSIAQRQGVLDLLSQGRGPGFNFGNTGYDPQKAQALQQSTDAYRQYANTPAARNPLMGAVDMPNQKQQMQGNTGGGGSGLGRLASGALGGAGTGMMFGPIGAGIGAGIGGLMSLFGGGKPKDTGPRTLYQGNQQAPTNPYYQTGAPMATGRMGNQQTYR